MFEWYPERSRTNAEERQIPFSKVPAVFEGPLPARRDMRHDYGEERWVAIGLLGHVPVVVIYTKRGPAIASASCRQGGPTAVSANASKRGSWRRADADRLETMSVEELAEHLDAMPEERIDYTGIPPLDDEFFRTAELLMPRPKRAISLRLDADLLDWLRAPGPGYQSRINAVLRAYMEARRRAGRSLTGRGARDRGSGGPSR